MNATVEKEIEHLLRARYPVLWIVSSEERRVQDSLQRVLGKLPGSRDGAPDLYTWSITEGIRLRQNGVSEATVDPVKALRTVLGANATSRQLFLLRDFHPYVKNPEVARLLRDCARELKGTHKTLVIVSSQLALPPEAEKEIAVLEYPLPELAELETIVDKLASLVPNKPSPEERRAIAEAALGLTADEAEATMAKSLVQCGGQFDVEVITGEKAKIVAKSGILEFVKTHQSMDEIGGLDQLKGWLRKRRAAFAPEARDFGLPSPRGLLMLGIPGGGKSLTAKAIGSAWKLPLLRLDMGKIFAGVVGSSEENMRRAIATAEAVAPSILWIDELEKGFSGTGSSNSSDGGTAARVFGSFITWMQEKTSPVFVVATANDVSQLPPEMLRKGRFDEIFFVDLPSLEERLAIVAIHITRRDRHPEDFNLDTLAEASAGFTGAEIEQAVVSALFDAYDIGGAKGKLTTAGILDAMRETNPLSKTMKEGIDNLRAWSGSRARPASTPAGEGKRHRGIDLS